MTLPINDSKNLSGLEVIDKTPNDVRAAAIDDTFTDEEVYGILVKTKIDTIEDFTDLMDMLKTRRPNVVGILLENLGYERVD